MKPPMRDTVKLTLIELDENGNPAVDRFGRPKTYEGTSKARVQYNTKTIYDANGVAYQTHAEVDLPASTPIEDESEITYTNSMGKEVTQKVISIDSALNFAGTKVYYRTVNLG